MFNPNRLTSGYALIWSRELFRDELTAITDWLKDRDQRSAIDLLFEEALRGPHPGEDLADIDDGPTAVFDPWTPEPHPSDEEPPENHCRTFGRYVLAHVDDLPVYTPRRYYLWRNRPTEEADGPETSDWLTLQREWTAVVEDLVRRGYLDRRAGDACEDGQENEQPSRINQLILDSCGLGDQWPLTLDEGDLPMDEDYFFTLVEVFHDLVARPRVRNWHSQHCHHSAAEQRLNQHPRPAGRGSRRPRPHPVLCPQSPRRFRDVRPPPWCQRPRDCSPNPPPITRHPRQLHPGAAGLDR